MSQILVTGEAKIRDIQGPVVANSGVITALDGAASQYVRGDGALADFPTSSGGGSSVSYYLNSSVSQGTIGGVAYRELSKEPIIGAGTDITISANGYVASYITDANDPSLLEVPGGNFNCEFYFSVNTNGRNPYVYAELYKYDGTTFTLLGSSQSIPEYLSNGSTLSAYYFAIPVATAALTITDRLAIRIYVNVDTRIVTLHTENGHLCQVVTTFSKGMVSLNNLTKQTQFLATGTSGTDFAIVSSNDTHTFNLPSASASNRGLITTGTQTFAGIKVYNNPIKGEEGILLKNGITSSSNGYTALNGFDNTLAITSSISGTPYSNYLEFTPSTTNAYNFPNLSGTLALLEGSQTFSGAKTFSVSPISEAGYAFKILASGTLFQNGYSVISSLSGNVSITQAISAGNLKAFTFDFSAWATNTSRTYTLPDATGTIALTSNLSAYLPLIGGTLTGPLGGTTAAFSDSGTATNTNLISLLQPNLTASSGPILTLGKSIGINNAASIQFYYTSNNSSSNSLLLALYGSTGLTIYGNGNASFAGTLGVTGALSATSALFNGSVDVLNGQINLSNSYYLTARNNANNTFLRLIGRNPSDKVVIDTDGYGTILGGALSGTSATFSGSLGVNSTIRSTGQTDPTGGVGMELFYRAADTSSYIQSYDRTNGAWKDVRIYGNTLYFGSQGSNNLTIASTGAATFSSSVTATGGLISNGGAIGYGGGELGFGVTTSGALSAIYTLSTGSPTLFFDHRATGNTGNFVFRNGSGGANTLLTIASTGAATFSSSVSLSAAFNSTDANGGYIVLQKSGSARGYIGSAYHLVAPAGSSNDLSISNDAGNIVFVTGGSFTERMRINSNGNIGMNRTGATNSVLGIRGQNQNSSTFCLLVDNAVTDLLQVRNDGLIFFGTAASAPYNYNVTFNPRSAALGQGGDFGYIVSTRESKGNIETINNTDFVKQLNPVSFNYRKKNADNTEFIDELYDDVYYGFIADEVEKVNKDLVFYDNLKDGSKKLAGVEYNSMIAILTKAIQEQQAQIEAQDVKIEELKALIAAK